MRKKGVPASGLLLCARLREARTHGPHGRGYKNRDTAAGLESLSQSDVPEPALNGRNGLVVGVLKRASHKRRILVKHVLHPECDGSVIKPPLPGAAAIFSLGYRDDVFLVAVLYLHVLTTILGKAGHLRRCRG